MNKHEQPNHFEVSKTLNSEMTSRKKQRIIRSSSTLLVVVALLFTFWWFVYLPIRSNRVVYDTVAISRQDLVVRVQAIGNIQPSTEVEVSSERSGVLRSIYVEANSNIKKGDILAELDDEMAAAGLERAKAVVAAAEARLSDAKATLAEKRLTRERAKKLGSRGLLASQEEDKIHAAQAKAEALLAAAGAEVAIAKAELRMRETDLEKMRIVSPVNGTVLKRNAEPGQTVASSLQAPVLFTLAEDLTRMKLEAEIDEADIGLVKPGQMANFKVDAYPNKVFSAVIKTIEYSPEMRGSVVTYKAVLSINNHDLLLRPGMTATAQIVVDQLSEALVVSNAALRYQQPPAPPQMQGITSLFTPRPQRKERSIAPPVGDEQSIYLLSGDSAVEVKVRIGVSDGIYTVIHSDNIKPGDLAIVSSYEASP